MHDAHGQADSSFDVSVGRCHIGDNSTKVDKGIYLFEDFVINFDVDLSIIFADDLDLCFSDVDGQAKLLTPFLDFIDK